MSKLFYVEDEPFLAKVVCDTLKLKGYDVILYTSGKEALLNWKNEHFDLAILDVMLPDLDGFELGHKMRQQGYAAPLMFLTARSFTEDVLRGFEVGASDYLRKPFSMEELIARIQVQLAWSSKQLSHQEVVVESIIQLGDFAFNPSAMTLTLGLHVIQLSYKENHVLSMLARNINLVTDRKELLLTVWGDDSFFNSRTLDVYIRKLRTFLANDPKVQLITLKGKGYLLRCD